MGKLKMGNWETLLTSSPCHRGATGTGPAWEPHWLRENAVLQGLARGIRVREIAAGNNRESTFRVVARKCNDWNSVETDPQSLYIGMFSDPNVGSAPPARFHRVREK